MTLPRKDACSIIVGNHTYRWAVSPDSGFMWLIVESAEHGAQRLEAQFKYHYHDTHSAQRRRICPSVVRQIVEIALARGWQPAQRSGQPFRMDDADQLVPPDASGS